MKEKFSTIDLFSVLQDLRRRLVGMRVANVYDIDQKTYLIKLARPDEKAMLLFESGCRLHTTEFEWPKHMQPSGFSMKMRKHLRTRRLISITQLGVDRVVDMQFGSNEAAYHVILELYDRGNVILTDYTYTILTLLRTRTDTDTDVRFAVRETFSQDTIKQEQPPPSVEMVHAALAGAKPGDQLRHVLNPHFVYGSALLSHSLHGGGFSENAKIGSGFDPEKDIAKLMAALEEADMLFRRLKDEPSKGYIIQKKYVQPQVESAASNEGVEDLHTNVEYHPMLFRQHQTSPYKEFETLTKAVDEFYSAKTSQKQDMKSLHMQKSAVKKLDNIRKDHQRRIDALQKTQGEDIYKAQLIELNVDLIERASLVIRSAIANAMDWGDIELLVKDAQARGDPVAMAIHGLRLKSNEITLTLRDPTEEEEEDSGEEEGKEEEKKHKKKLRRVERGTKVDIDLGLSVFANARRYYDHKKHAAKKEQKTLDASEKALKSAEKKTKKTLKEVSTIAKIQKARKVHWFEKFFWFISSENYLVIGGRDQQQNELIVKKYLDEGDLYVHADLHGATSVVIKNHSGGLVPPKTLNEAGTMAVCYSTAWEARIVTSAWWVYHYQVSKTAPTGEYLTTGSFMIRGKKNFLPPCQLLLGFGFLFRVDDSCISNHLHERLVRGTEDDEVSMLSEAASELTLPETLDGEEIGEGEDIGEEQDIGEEDSGDEQEGDDPSSGKSDEEEDTGLSFPDTTIQLQHVSGEKYELQRGTSVTSSQVDESEPPSVNATDNGEHGEQRRHHHISAKQRRELRKVAKQQSSGKNGHDQQVSPAASRSSKKPEGQLKNPPQPPRVQEQPQVKRGQKAKQKKMQEKYADQDEEERQLRMEILASARPAKEQKVKKGKKGKKSRPADPTQPTNPKYKYYQKGKGKTPSTLVEPGHKQKAPSLDILPVAEVKQKVDISGLKHEACARDPVDEALIVEGVESRRREEMDGEDKAETLQTLVVEDLEEAAEVSGTELQSGVTENRGNDADYSDPRTSSVDLPEVVVSRTHTAAENDSDIVTASLLKDFEHAGPVLEAVSQKLTQQEEEESDEEEKRALLAEENAQQLKDAEKEQLSVLDSFTGCPLPEDILLYSIPVCAPYTAVLNYKYKVKLIPGTSRRGKAAKAALHRFLQSREATQTEKDLLKSTKDTDLSRYIPGKVKMSLPQATYKQQHR